MSCRRARVGEPEEGRILLLSLVYALVAGVLVLTVVAVSAVHLQRKQVLAVADAAAADAADAVDAARYYAPGGGAGAPGAGVPLSRASVRASVVEHLRRSGAEGTAGGLLVGAATGSPDGRTAVVELVAHLQPPWAAVGPVWLGRGVEVRVTSRAVASLS